MPEKKLRAGPHRSRIAPCRSDAICPRMLICPARKALRFQLSRGLPPGTPTTSGCPWDARDQILPFGADRSRIVRNVLIHQVTHPPEPSDETPALEEHSDTDGAA
jgi:hypothetical protein